MSAENVLENWERNLGDATDGLVALVRNLIPDMKSKDVATKAIYEHVRDVQYGKTNRERADVVSFLDSLADLRGPHAAYLRVLATCIGEEHEHVGAAERRRARTSGGSHG